MSHSFFIDGERHTCERFALRASDLLKLVGKDKTHRLTSTWNHEVQNWEDDILLMQEYPAFETVPL